MDGLGLGVLGSDRPAVDFPADDGHLRPNSGLRRARANRFSLFTLLLVSLSETCWTCKTWLPTRERNELVFVFLSAVIPLVIGGWVIWTAHELRTPGNPGPPLRLLLMTGLESSERLLRRLPDRRLLPLLLTVDARCPALWLRHRTAGVDKTILDSDWLFHSIRSNSSGVDWCCCCCWTGRRWWVGDGGGSIRLLPAFLLNRKLGVVSGTMGGCWRFGGSLLAFACSSSSDGQINTGDGPGSSSTSGPGEESRKSTTPRVIWRGWRCNSDVLYVIWPRCDGREGAIPVILNRVPQMLDATSASVDCCPNFKQKNTSV